MRLIRDVVRMPTSVKAVLPEAARALEETWQRRRRELGGWQPSGGWLIEPRAPRLTGAALLHTRAGS